MGRTPIGGNPGGSTGQTPWRTPLVDSTTENTPRDNLKNNYGGHTWEDVSVEHALRTCLWKGCFSILQGILQGCPLVCLPGCSLGESIRGDLQGKTTRVPFVGSSWVVLWNVLQVVFLGALLDVLLGVLHGVLKGDLYKISSMGVIHPPRCPPRCLHVSSRVPPGCPPRVPSWLSSRVSSRMSSRVPSKLPRGVV
jgi:hypothetical protein